MDDVEASRPRRRIAAISQGGIGLPERDYYFPKKEDEKKQNIRAFDEQLFFLGYAQSWCETMRPDFERLLVSTNPHSPPKFRVNGPLSNMKEFAAAFSCKPGDKMVRENRCEVG